MNVVGAVRDAIRKCGRTVTLTKDEIEYSFTACIQPRSYNTITLTRPELTRFGKTDARQFTFYGPLDGGGELVEDGSVLVCGDESYRVTVCHDFWCLNERVFRWAVAHKLTAKEAEI